MAELIKDDVVLASAEIARGFRGRLRGLLGRDGVDGAFVLAPAASVHSFGMRFAIDVAFCAADGEVLRTDTIGPNRLSRVVPRSRTVIEAEAGSFSRWGVQIGDRLAVRT